MDEMKLKREILEELMAYLDKSQGSELHEELEKRKPKPAVAVAVEMEKKPEEDAEEEGDVDPAMLKAEEDEEMSDDEIEEMLKGLG